MSPRIQRVYFQELISDKRTPTIPKCLLQAQLNSQFEEPLFQQQNIQYEMSPSLYGQRVYSNHNANKTPHKRCSTRKDCVTLQNNVSARSYKFNTGRNQCQYSDIHCNILMLLIIKSVFAHQQKKRFKETLRWLASATRWDGLRSYFVCIYSIAVVKC